jgi:hypothetical protein
MEPTILVYRMVTLGCCCPGTKVDSPDCQGVYGSERTFLQAYEEQNAERARNPLDRREWRPIHNLQISSSRS